MDCIESIINQKRIYSELIRLINQVCYYFIIRDTTISLILSIHIVKLMNTNKTTMPAFKHDSNLNVAYQKQNLSYFTSYCQSRQRRRQKGLKLSKQLEKENKQVIQLNIQNLSLSDDLSQRINTKKQTFQHSSSLQQGEILDRFNQNLSENEKVNKQVSSQTQFKKKQFEQNTQSQESQYNRRLELYYQQREVQQESQIFMMRNLNQLFHFRERINADLEENGDEQGFVISKKKSSGLCFKQIDELPCTKHICKDNQKILPCQICLQNIQELEQCTFLFCFHGFHSKCIKHWLVNNIYCPMCKMNMKQEMMKVRQFSENK